MMEIENSIWKKFWERENELDDVRKTKERHRLRNSNMSGWWNEVALV